MSAFAALVDARVAGVSLRVDAGSLAWEAVNSPPPRHPLVSLGLTAKP